eukprot:CAMPEP_0182872756 /NCGR_PEP_ID=MMETSP0034_2-20130328/11914_1 /TAXON_ID=156128 /ORGANISM="Nephroselmis pyriformis, Strain CCMP717" /LENGTH=72 /DNA_ID=CAMNT_0025005363 /DNA_START=1 /DNA_END=215 /DNA_ORIENTATION=-
MQGGGGQAAVPGVQHGILLQAAVPRVQGRVDRRLPQARLGRARGEMQTIPAGGGLEHGSAGGPTQQAQAGPG